MVLTNKQKGTLLLILSTFLFAAMQVVVRIAGANLPLMERAFFRNSVSLILAFFIIKKNHLSMFGTKKDQPLLMGRSISGFLGVILVFYASSYANQADVAILTKMSPFLTTICAAVFLKEKILKIQFPAMIIAFIGAFFVVNPNFDSNALPVISALLGAVTSGLSYTFISACKNKVDPVTVVMHFSFVSTALCVPFMLFDFVFPTLYEWFLLFLIGFFGSMGQIAITYAYKLAPAGEVSIYNYFGVIFSMLLGYFILGEHVASSSFFGGILVIGASLLVYFYSKNQDKKAAR